MLSDISEVNLNFETFQNGGGGGRGQLLKERISSSLLKGIEKQLKIAKVVSLWNKMAMKSLRHTTSL